MSAFNNFSIVTVISMQLLLRHCCLSNISVLLALNVANKTVSIVNVHCAHHNVLTLLWGN